MINLEPIRLAMIRQGIDFEESIKFIGINISFGLYGINGNIKTAFFVDHCICCPIHGSSDSEDQKNKYLMNSKLLSKGLIVIRAWQCLATGAPNKVVERLKFSVTRPLNFKAYCSILHPRGINT